MKANNHFGAPLKLTKPIYQWDQSVAPGLGIRINRDGSKHYVAKLSIAGRGKWFTIGPVDLFDLDAVRHVVARMKLLAKAGKDPKHILNQFLAGQAAPELFGITFGAFADVYIEKYAKVHKRSWLKDRQRIDLYLMPVWKDKTLCQIDRLDVSSIHAEIGKTRPYAANRLLEVVGVMFKQAILLGYLPERQLGITEGIRRYKEHSKEHNITAQEKQRIMQVLDTFKADRIHIAAMRLAFETGFRSGEIIGLRWSEVDMDRREINLITTKAGRPFTQPLTAAAVEILSSLPQTNDWVFPSRRIANRHISRIDKLFKRVCAQAGVKKASVHSIRHYVGRSVLEHSGSLEMVAAVLNHSSLQTTKVYAKYQKDSVRQALELQSARVQSPESENAHLS